MAAGAIVLTGHFQTALYAFFALAIFLAADAVLPGGSLRGSALAVLVAVGAGAALSAVMVLPGLELTGESVRAGADYSKDAGASLAPGALATLVIPDHYGALETERYTGPQDITQFYFYMGILLVPLAMLGLTSARERWYGLALTVAGVWYAMGPAGGLYSLVSHAARFSQRARAGPYVVRGGAGAGAAGRGGGGSAAGAFPFAVDRAGAAGNHGTRSVLLEYGAQRPGVRARELSGTLRQRGGSIPHGGRAADRQSAASHLGGQRFTQFRTVQ